MKIPLLYGFYMALAGALLTLGLYFAGFHDNAEKMSSAQVIGSILGIAIGIGGLALAMRAKRALAPADGSWGYGSAFGTGVLTGLFAAIFGAIFAYIYFGMINPHMSDVILQMQIAKMEAKGVPAASIERAEPMMRKMMTPVAMTVMQFIMGFIWSVLLSLIIAIFFKKKETVAPPLPPTMG